MRIYADFHLHSHFSRATSPKMGIEELSKNASLKGLNMLGTGDFTHPLWLKELKARLKPFNDSGLLIYDKILWMLTCEVSTVYEQDRKIRKIHHLIHVPSFEIVDQINDVLLKRGNLASNGRPLFHGLSSPELVEIIMEISKDSLIIPSHAWTSWWSVFGAFSGFDSIKECYMDQKKYVYAIETGLSSDPSMNWRLSELDDFCMMSNSDAHSPWIWRIGREFNAFELKKPSYWEILNAVKNKDDKTFIFTGEVSPQYGKYHYTGHRKCKISLPPRDAIKLNNKCPKCGKKLTVGVLQRVEELADRPQGYRPKKSIPFKTLLPLYEILSYVSGTNHLYSKKISEELGKLILKFGNELNILLSVEKDQLNMLTSPKIANAIIDVREEKVRYEAGYDGVYGLPIFNTPDES